MKLMQIILILSISYATSFALDIEEVEEMCQEADPATLYPATLIVWNNEKGSQSYASFYPPNDSIVSIPFSFILPLPVKKGVYRTPDFELIISNKEAKGKDGKEGFLSTLRVNNRTFKMICNPD